MYIDNNNHGSTLITANSRDNHNQNSEKNRPMDSKGKDKFIEVLEDTRSEKEVIENMRNLVENITSMIKTGMSKDEIEALENAIKRIKEEIEKKNYDKKKIEQMMEDLEKAINYYKNRMAGGSILNNDSKKEKEKTNKTDETNETLELAIKNYKDINSEKKDKSSDNKNSDTFIEKIISKLDNFIDDVTKLKNGTNKFLSSQLYTKSEILEEIIKFNNK
ncbi:hypothetical protein [Arcobacter sp.]|uniref:hypothetical protein n=1 Tax=Arcobacter sp. TaxID=1872629 RepID=UPI003D134099